MSRILLVDDEPSILSVLSTLLRAEGYDVEPVQGGEKARELARTGEFDLLITDIRMVPVNGMELLREARERRPPLTAIMLTGFGTVETAIEALKLGAHDYVTKPFKVDELLITIQRAIQFSQTMAENVSLKQQLGARLEMANLVAESPAMRNVCDMIRRIAPTETTVLIYGESGTGKELVAKAIHSNSSRKDGKFIAVNCAALPETLLESEMFGYMKGAFTGASANKEGLFEAAGGGTLFLDEVGSIPLSIQGKLLRVLQEKEVRRLGSNTNTPVDARVLAATNTPLEQLIQEGKFREDLYYRLSVIPIEIKPLRERLEDILPIVKHVLAHETPAHRDPPAMDPSVIRILESYTWPGNVRELENAVKHALAFAQNNRITRDCLPARVLAGVRGLVPIAAPESPEPASAQAPAPDAIAPITTPVPTPNAAPAFAVSTPAAEAPAASTDVVPLKLYVRRLEREYLTRVIATCGGSKEAAAKVLRISLATLYRKLPEAEKPVAP